MEIKTIIESLRHCTISEGDCRSCPSYHHDSGCLDRLHAKAAAALESQQKRIAELEAQNRWIPVTERLPENEKDVLICAERRLRFGNVDKIIFIVSTAFHTDGKMNTEESAYTWETEYMNAEYDEDADAYIIPEGWWESVNYGECFSAVSDFVTHWMPLPEPPKEG